MAGYSCPQVKAEDECTVGDPDPYHRYFNSNAILVCVVQPPGG